MRAYSAIRWGSTAALPLSIGTPQAFQPAIKAMPAASGAQAQIVRVWATINVNIAVGVVAVATQSDLPLAPGTELYVLVNAGENLSVISGPGEPNGNVYFTTVTRY